MGEGKLDITPMVALFSEFFTTVYMPHINNLLLIYPTKKSLIVDYRELEKFDPDLADRLIHEPDVLIEAAETAIKDMKLSLPAGVAEFAPHVKFSDFPSAEVLIEHLNSRNINEIVSFKGVVTRRAEVMNRVKLAVYKCQVCDSEVRAPVTKNFVPPKRCDSCKKFALKQMDEDSRFVDIQRAEIQELLERVRGGAPAAHIELLLEDDLINSISPGDNVEVVGMLRLRPPLKVRQKQELVYARYIEVVYVRSLKRDFEELEISKEDEKHLLELSKNPNIEDLIMKSVAPAIYGHEEVKRALALQLFGGTKGKTIPGGLPIRDDIHVLLIGDPGLAKCTDGDAKVLLADGSVQKIRDIVEQTLVEKGEQKVEDGVYATSNHDLLSLNLDGRIEQSKATHFWKLEAPEYLYEIETQTGKRVRVTGEHPFFVSSDGQVSSLAAKELKPGKFIATPHKISIKGKPQPFPPYIHGKTNASRIALPKTLTKEFARFLGYLIGDGYVRRTTSYEISLTNSDEVLLNDFTNILQSFSLPVRMKTDKTTNAKIATTFSVELGQILRLFGVIEDSFGKTVPQAIMKSPDEVIKEFIKAYFDCEASIGEAGITVVSASRELLESVQLLLLRFGIISLLHETYSRATNAKNHQKTKYYRLFLFGENAAKYGTLISFTSPIKVAKLAKQKQDFNTNIDVIPNLRNILKQTRVALGISQFLCGIPRTTYQHFERGDRNPSYSSLHRIVAAFSKEFSAVRLKLSAEKSHQIAASIQLLRLLSESHIFWDKVKRIEKIKPQEKWVYDLQVDDVHNFIANNLIVHNSRFLHQVSELAPKSIYVSGKSVSSAGLTVSAEKDELGEGGWTLKAGALVLASGGNIAIDEFDKISEEDRSAMHEAMESQQISVAKAGIVAQFKSKTAILAAANPKYGRFDQTRNLAEQFEVAPTLLSRFDLIFPIVDVLDEEKDSRLAQHILAAHTGRASKEEERLIDKDLLRKYIAYARRGVSPQLTNSAVEKIRDFYVELRRMSKDVGSVAITPRYLEGLVRLCEANAKMRLSQLAEEKDADTAISLMRYVMKQVMTDKATGLFDVDTVATGKPKSERDKLQKVDIILEIIREHLKKEDSAELEAVVSDAVSYGIDEPTARRILSELLRRGEIYEREHGHIRLVGERS